MRNSRILRCRRGRGFSNAHFLMIVGCLLEVSSNLQQFRPTKQDISKNKNTKQEEWGQKVDFLAPQWAPDMYAWKCGLC